MPAVMRPSRRDQAGKGGGFPPAGAVGGRTPAGARGGGVAPAGAVGGRTPAGAEGGRDRGDAPPPMGDTRLVVLKVDERELPK